MQEFFVMVGLSVLLAVAAFAEVPSPQAQSARTYQGGEANLSSVPREHAANVNDGRAFVPEAGTATFVDTTTEVSSGNARPGGAADESIAAREARGARAASTTTTLSTGTAVHTGTGAIPSDPPKMPERRAKPSGFR